LVSPLPKSTILVGGTFAAAQQICSKGNTASAEKRECAEKSGSKK
jgi:hypothetical protein